MVVKPFAYFADGCGEQVGLQVLGVVCQFFGGGRRLYPKVLGVVYCSCGESSSTTVAEGAVDFSAEDVVSTFKSSELSIVPVVNQVSTTVVEGMVLLDRLGLSQCLLVGKPVVSHLHHAENESNHTS
jgi:hypothetical protein